MRLAHRPELDALCGEYLLGTLQGRARRRFERALDKEPEVALRLRRWMLTFPLVPSAAVAVEPSPGVWRRLSRELELSRYRPAWHRRLGPWRALAASALAGLVLAVALPRLDLERAVAPRPVAELAAKGAPPISALASTDRTTLHLEPARPVLAGPAQSYELWLIPVEGGAPLSLAVLGDLSARVPVAPAHARRLVPGATLAISVEPAGGSPTGAPTGPVVYAGKVTL